MCLESVIKRFKNTSVHPPAFLLEAHAHDVLADSLVVDDWRALVAAHLEHADVLVAASSQKLKKLGDSFLKKQIVIELVILRGKYVPTGKS